MIPGQSKDYFVPRHSKLFGAGSKSETPWQYYQGVLLDPLGFVGPFIKSVYLAMLPCSTSYHFHYQGKGHAIEQEVGYESWPVILRFLAHGCNDKADW